MANIDIQRREFVKNATAISSLAGLATLAGCLGDDDDDDGEGIEPVDEEELGEPVPTLTFLNFPEDFSPTSHDMYNLAIEHFNDVGFDVSVELLEFGAIGQRVVDGEFDIAGWRNAVSEDPGREMYNWYHSDNADLGGGVSNWAGYENPEVDNLLEEQLKEVDDDQRAEILHEFQEIVVEDAPRLPITESDSLIAYRSDMVDGWVQDVRGANFTRSLFNLEVDTPNQELIVMDTENVPHLNPYAGRELPSRINLNAIYDFLIRFDEELLYDPDISLATNYESIDETTWEFTIRDGVTWHDGEDLTAEDVAFSFNYIVEQEVPLFVTEANPIEKAEVVNGNKVRINLNEPVGAFLLHAPARVRIVPKHIWEDTTDPSEVNVEEPIGSGPLQFDYWDRNEELSLVSNDDHWVGVDFNRRTWRVIPQFSVGWELLSQGDVHYIPRPPISAEMEQRAQEENIAIHESPRPWARYMTFNVRNHGLDEKVIRQACMESIPKDLIAQDVFLGYESPADSPIPSAHGIYHNPDVESYDGGVQEAQERLLDAGFNFDEDGRVHYPANQE